MLLYHVWPNWLPAGYIGVDVFFVISGFLITGLLLKDLERDGRIAFRRFYLRRFRRLMPAASVVIMVTLSLSWLLEPPFRREGTAIEGLASALYFQNWLLAARATDYLDAERALGPLTHYWSLSIEEQFYLLWPLTLAIVGLIASHRGWPLRRLAQVAILAISLLSLGCSWWLAHQGFSEVYFVTHTRVWELGLGALLALRGLTNCGPQAARWIASIGLLVILGSAALIPENVSFPGLIALVPTLATVAFLWVGTQLNGAHGFSWLMARPIQFAGDASYSVYLWHWPLIYFASLLLGGSLDFLAGLAIVLLSLLIGGFSKRWIEDTFRDQGSPGYSATRAGFQTVLLFLFSLTLALAIFAHARVQFADFQPVNLGDEYPGAMSLVRDAETPPSRPPLPKEGVVKLDIPVVYGRDCHTSPRSPEVRPCVLRRSKTSRATVVIVGDSHAANWVPAMEAVASKADWDLISMTKSSCSLTLPTVGPALHSDDSCLAWSDAVLDLLHEIQPDMVLLARKRMNTDFASTETGDWIPGLVAMLNQVLAALHKVSSQVVVLADTPRLPFDPPSCLAREGECTALLEGTFDPPDALLAAADRQVSVQVVDLRHLVCPEGVCQSVIGNIVVWRDDHHFTATYSRSMAPELMRQLEPGD